MARQIFDRERPASPVLPTSPLRRRRSLRFITGLITLVLLASPQRSFAEEGNSGANDPIVVMTYNVRYANPNDGRDVWSGRVKKVAEVIASADIAGLQEVTHGQLVDLQERLGGFEFHGVGRDDGERGGEYSPIFFRRDRFEMTSQGTFWLSATPTEVGSRGWDAALPRICSWAVLKDRDTQGKVWVANTHFDHRGAKARLQSARLIVERARHRPASLPAIVMGDFNASPQSAPYAALIAGKGRGQLVDARILSARPPGGPDSTWNGFNEVVPGRIIDHLLVSPSMTVESLNVIDPRTDAGRFASDHLPVVARVRLGTQGASDRPKSATGQADGDACRP